jgi:hypothetical protein
MMQDLLNAVEFRQLGRRKKTKGTYQTFFNVFFDWFKDVKDKVPYDRIGTEYSRHLLQNGRNNTTHNNHNRNLQSFFADMITQHGEKYKGNPFRRSKNPNRKPAN